jgi:hypothetical protein
VNVGGALVPRLPVRSDAHSRNLRLHRLTDIPATFFITQSLHPKKPILDQAAREIIVSAFAHNPVAKGLVEKAEQWDASSANRKDLITNPWPWLLDEA